MKKLILIASLTSACGGSAPVSDPTQQEAVRSSAKPHETPEENMHEPSPHAHHFDEPEKYAERWNSAERTEWQKPDEVIAIMQIEAGQTVADLGAGTGYFEPYLAAAVGPSGHVYALDVEDAMILWLKDMVTKQSLTNVEPLKAALDATGLPDNSLDRLLTVNTWHHIADREEYAAKLFKVIKPGGRVVVVDFTKEAKDGPPLEMRLAPDVIARELQAGGFKTEIVAETLPRQFIVVATKK